MSCVLASEAKRHTYLARQGSGESGDRHQSGLVIRASLGHELR